ncbi:tail fiber protein [Candidatus Sumerlaeota bacterium]|nr:tail fiber protein [Candidatus Sumerlaeota bacterium]
MWLNHLGGCLPEQGWTLIQSRHLSKKQDASLRQLFGVPQPSKNLPDLRVSFRKEQSW